MQAALPARWAAGSWRTGGGSGLGFPAGPAAPCSAPRLGGAAGAAGSCSAVAHRTPRGGASGRGRRRCRPSRRPGSGRAGRRGDTARPGPRRGRPRPHLGSQPPARPRAVPIGVTSGRLWMEPRGQRRPAGTPRVPRARPRRWPAAVAPRQRASCHAVAQERDMAVARPQHGSGGDARVTARGRGAERGSLVPPAPARLQSQS